MAFVFKLRNQTEPKYRFQDIRDEKELEKYIDRFGMYVGVKLPTEYFQKNRVIGCYDQTGKMVAGYTIATEGLRGLNVIPEESKQTSTFLQNVDEDRMVEVNALWISRRVKTKGFRIKFWTRVYRDLKATSRPYLLLWFNARVPYLRRLYSFVNLKKVYEGAIAARPGMSSHSSGEVYSGYARISQIPSALVKAQAFYWWRELRTRLGVRVRTATA